MKKNKATKKPTNILNRRAKFDYELGDELTVGIVLSGQETRAARDGLVQLKGAFVTIKNDELWLNNASFSIRLNQKGDSGARSIETAPRKLLATRKQISQLEARKAKGMSIVPVKLIPSGRYVKVIIALGKGKKLYDKRETMKRRDQEREISRTLKEAN